MTLKFISGEEISKEMEKQFNQFRRSNPNASELMSCFLKLREVKKLKQMIENGSNEREIDKLIQGEPNLLSAVLDFVSTGHHGGKAYSQKAIMPHISKERHGLIPDYLISGRSSDGISWWVLELKSPKAKIFSGSGNKLRLSSGANRGVIQLLKYLDFCSQHQSMLRDTLKLERFREPNGLLIIGREDELELKERQEVKNAWNINNPRLKIRTWSSIIRSLEHKLYFHGSLKKDTSTNNLVEDCYEN